MNVKRYTARTSRDALALVRQALGEDAVVLSTQPCAEGVEVLAMSPGGIQKMQQQSSSPGAAAALATLPDVVKRSAERPAATPGPAETSVANDVEQLAMSTLSFQDYVRERMLKRRATALKAEAPVAPPAVALRAPARLRELPLLRESIAFEAEAVAPVSAPAPKPAEPALAKGDQQDMMSELRAMKGLIEDRFDALAFRDKLQRQPAHARLAQKLLDCGFSPALIRKLTEGMGTEVVDESTWVASVLEHNLLTAEAEPALEDQGGVFALIGSTGVGKTTSTAKLAAAFAGKHGASNLGLITLDAYRVGAHEQLRAYGRILGVPVHTAHDRASLEDLLDLLSAKKMVLIDTAGMAQRDSRTRELLDMLSHRAIQKLLVVNAAAQGETTEDVLLSYRASQARGVVLSKLDEAVKLGPALDALIRHKLPVTVVANGQRVPEDWHRLSAHALVQRALRPLAGTAYRMDANEVDLVFSAPRGQPAARSAAHA